MDNIKELSEEERRTQHLNNKYSLLHLIDTCDPDDIETILKVARNPKKFATLFSFLTISGY
jgi:hypothetical protein